MTKKLFCIVMALVLALGAAGAMAEGLTVQGTGYVTVKADTATISLGMRQYAKDVKEAQQAVNRCIDAVISALTEAGVDKEDMYTDSIYIYPEYDYSSSSMDGEKIIGYYASNSLTIVTRDIDNVGAYIDAAFEAGANTLDGVSFNASDTRDAYDQALVMAIEEATRKAAVMAEAAGVELGEIERVSEGENYGYSSTAMYSRNAVAEEDAGAGTQVIAARQQVSATVTIEFEIKD